MKFLIKLFLILFTCTAIQAQEFPKEIPGKIVHDFASLLNASELNQLETMLVKYNDTTSTQIAVVTVKTINGYEINDYGTRLYNQWGIGQKGKDNGVLILIKPKSDDEPTNRMAIVTGYGMEALLPDVVAKRIIDHEMAPRFKEGAYFQGIVAGANIIFQLASGAYSPDQYMNRTGGKKKSNLIPIIIVIVIVLIFSGFGSKNKGGKNISSRGDIPLWILLSLLNSGGGRGSFGGFSSGGGGFGGFGGGRSGGGGASGSW